MDQGTAQQESFSRVCEEALGSNLALRGKEGEGREREREMKASSLWKAVD